MVSKNQQKIFKQFLYNEKLLFSEILIKTKISSNLLAYFLKKMLKDNLLKKDSLGKYSLTIDGEKLIPFYTEHNSLSPLVVLLLGVLDDDKILLIQREKRPYKGFWSLISGRLLLNESICDGAKRICKTKLKCDCNIIGVNSVIHERLFDKETKHAFVFFFLSVSPIGRTLEHSGLKWVSLKKIPKSKVIASDYWLIKNKLSSKIEIVEEIIDKGGKKMIIQ